VAGRISDRNDEGDCANCVFDCRKHGCSLIKFLDLFGRVGWTREDSSKNDARPRVRSKKDPKIPLGFHARSRSWLKSFEVSSSIFFKQVWRFGCVFLVGFIAIGALVSDVSFVTSTVYLFYGSTVVQYYRSTVTFSELA
jgi:hypothetical protein